MEHPRAKLRWFLRHDVLVDRSGRPAGGPITGGPPPIGRPVDDVYRSTYRRVLDRNRRYYERYPEDRRRVLALHERLNRSEIRLPNGDIVTPRRFRQIGTMLGMSHGAEQLHYIVELAPEAPAFRRDVQSAVRFTRNSLYAIIHEACYADGCVTNWSAERLLLEDYRGPELFAGEHVYSWMFEDYLELRPMRAAAELLAQWPWPRLYDAEQLARNEVPVAVAIYVDDMYVEREFSEETARVIRGLRPWITSGYEHNGLRADGDTILTHLIELTRGKR